uniref:Uncharacterized protein n=1 Tax=Spironucleus salmonicida TaxID=348837 RepID=V6LGT7_9EUKA|eukprot:EST42921.1 Hypothetical protein SS50377_17454 [Spironucleus salmonicida]
MPTAKSQYAQQNLQAYAQSISFSFLLSQHQGQPLRAPDPPHPILAETQVLESSQRPDTALQATFRRGKTAKKRMIDNENILHLNQKPLDYERKIHAYMVSRESQEGGQNISSEAALRRGFPTHLVQQSRPRNRRGVK